jgi:hypothetical protein
LLDACMLRIALLLGELLTLTLYIIPDKFPYSKIYYSRYGFLLMVLALYIFFHHFQPFTVFIFKVGFL